MRRRKESGMSILEIIFVISLIGGLMAILVQNLTSATDAAKEDQAKILMGDIQQKLQLYRLHNHRFPTTDQGLDALVNDPGAKKWRGPYIQESKLSDPWGTPLEYESDGRNFKIISGGLNQVVGDEDDIVFPEE